MKSLNEEEREKLVSSLQDLIDRGRFVEIANFHGGPPLICPEKTDNNQFCCEHGHLLLPWHRLFVVQMEEELGEPIPYWDWTEDNSEVPDLWLDIKAPIKKGIEGKCGDEKSCNAEQCDKQFVARQTNIELPRGLKESIRSAFEKQDFSEFRAIISSQHSGVHTSIGCEMSVDGTGAYDPLFYLHHSYVDLQWAYWQKLQQLRDGQTDELPNTDVFNQPIAPFHKDGVNNNTKTLRNNRGRDTLDYKGNFCYEYDKLLFNGKTPEQFLEKGDEILNEMEQETEQEPVVSFDINPKKSGKNSFLTTTWSPKDVSKHGTKGGVPDQGKCGKFCPKGKGKDDCEEICTKDKRQKVFVKVFVGVVMPHVAPSGDSTFDLCQGGKCVEAGKVSTFGSTTDPVDNPPKTQINAKNFYLAEADVTAVIGKQDWTLAKPLVAKMTKSMVGNLPQPVVIVQELGKGGMKVGGKVILSPEEKRSRYGNLLDKYSIDKSPNIHKYSS